MDLALIDPLHKTQFIYKKTVRRTHIRNSHKSFTTKRDMLKGDLVVSEESCDWTNLSTASWS